MRKTKEKENEHGMIKISHHFWNVERLKAHTLTDT